MTTALAHLPRSTPDEPAADGDDSAAAHLAPDAPRCCAHCGTPQAGDPGVVTVGSGAGATWYCCAGCRTVAEALQQGGLTEWYALAGDARAPAHTTARKYEELDDDAFTRRHVEISEDGLHHTRLYLEDLRCTACVWLVERLPELQPGVVEARVDLGRGLAEIAFDPRRAPLSSIGRALDRLGHPAHPYREVDRDAQRRREDRSLLIKIGVAGAAAGNVMLLAIALYAGWLGDAAEMTGGEIAFLRWASMLVALPALGFAATPFFRTALASLRSRRLHLDLPIAVGIAAGLGWGSANVIRGVGEIYFDSVGMLVFLLLIARFVQTRHQRKASIAAELLLALTPRRARLLLDGAPGSAARSVEVPVEAIAAGQRIELLPGETVPLDGILEEGTTAVDRGLLTGESQPIAAAPGDALFAGTVNLSAPIVLRATATGEATRLGQLVSRVAELARRRAPVERFVDRVAGRFTVIVAATAALTALGWALAGAPAAGLEHAMALLVVTCPCALALATPLAVSIALSRAARRGILIKGADVLEQLAEPGTLVVDKTGTLTLGVQRVTSWVGAPEIAALASALEAKSTHPVARAMCAFAPLGPAPVAIRDRRELFGRGIEGVIGGVSGGAIGGGSDARAATLLALPARHVAAGTPRWISSLATIPPQIEAEIAACRHRGESPVVVAVDHFAVAVAGLSDPLRPDAAAAVAALRALGWRVELLSGDDVTAVRRTGQSLQLPEDACHGGVLPEDKAAFIEHLTGAPERRGPVVMVGDGVNDAAALAAATCGIAMHGSAEASIEAADIYASRPGVAQLLAILQAARATMATIRRNLRLSLFYNITAATLAITGVIHPLVAAVLMPLSSLTVLISSLRSRAMRERAPAAESPSPGATS